MKSKLYWIAGVLVVGIAGVAGWSTWAQKSPKKVPKKDTIAHLYQVQPNKPVHVKQGSKGATHFLILLKKGAKIHPKAPFGCKLTSSKGLQLERQKLGRKQAQASKNNRRVKLPLSFSAQKKGAQTIDANCHFFVCTKDICARRQEEIQLTVNVR